MSSDIGASVARKVKIPFLMRILLNLEALPLGRVIQIMGPQASLKSTFAAEIVRWHLCEGGRAAFFETEGKPAAFVYMCLIETFGKEVVRICRVKRMEKWMQEISKQIRKGEELLEQGVNLPPMVFVVDSVLGCNSMQTISDVDERGYPSERFASESRRITDFLRSYSSRIADLPLTLIMVNHVKLRPTGFTIQKATVGGVDLRYRATFELELKREKSTSYLGGPCENLLTISVEKNSFGPDVTSISVPVIFDNRDRKIYFDWYSPLTRWLCDLRTDYVKPKPAPSVLEQIRGLFGISVRSGGPKGKLYYCESIGIEKENALPAHEFGKFLEENCQDKLAVLSEIIGIRTVDDIVSEESIDFEH